MNEKIQEILADLDIDLYTDEGIRVTKLLVRPKDLRQFAELVVRECAELVKGAQVTEDGHTWRSAESAMLKHFGIKS